VRASSSYDRHARRLEWLGVEAANWVLGMGADRQNRQLERCRSLHA
jgi:hypothetical protein